MHAYIFALLLAFGWVHHAALEQLWREPFSACAKYHPCERPFVSIVYYSTTLTWHLQRMWKMNAVCVSSIVGPFEEVRQVGAFVQSACAMNGGGSLLIAGALQRWPDVA
ncbi:hypothetical protein Vretimale_13162 [Volvox reticuliferus]|uniref:Uncharacterized protein n=1 Tax=Volvox reticuliferus TaxID=1737510 RepID=A0A8J4GLF1_9CHLO|nr:hypothetical protein Vretimale_13162 [Volvox reticuliferus]